MSYKDILEAQARLDGKKAASKKKSGSKRKVPEEV